MTIMDYASDLRLFVIFGIVLAMLVGSIGPSAAEFTIVILILQMTASLHGLKIHKKDFRTELKPALFSLICCFVIGTASALAMGLFFIGSNQAVWYGWVMLASVPAAVSVISVAILMKGNMSMAMISMVFIYVVAFAFTPILTHLLIGEAISPLKILNYVILFIAVPVILNYPLSRFQIQKKHKVVFINCTICLLIIIAFGECKECLLDDVGLLILLVLLCAVRTFGVGAILMYILRKKGISRENIVIYTGYSVWKSSGLACSMCLLLLDPFPEAALVCTTSVVVEFVWFAITNKSIAKFWPEDALSMSR